jgi:hypothetical protein
MLFLLVFSVIQVISMIQLKLKKTTLFRFIIHTISMISFFSQTGYRELIKKLTIPSMLILKTDYIVLMKGSVES